jgi:hypothetical protein
MTYLASAFTLNLCGIRLRLRIDLDDEPEPASAPPARVPGEPDSLQDE